MLADELRQADRRMLDDAVFELLGVGERAERWPILELVYQATATHFRQIRVVEIEKMEQRAVTANGRFTVQELAADAWDAAELPEVMPLAEWLERLPECTSPVNIPEDRPAAMSPSPMFDPNTVYFGKQRSAHLDCGGGEEARLVVQVANLGVSGWVKLPKEDEPCRKVRHELDARLDAAQRRFQELAESRTSDPRLQVEIVDQLMRWFAQGRTLHTPSAAGSAEAEETVDEAG